MTDWPSSKRGSHLYHTLYTVFDDLSGSEKIISLGEVLHEVSKKDRKISKPVWIVTFVTPGGTTVGTTQP